MIYLSLAIFKTKKVGTMENLNLQVQNIVFVGGTHGNELTGVHTIPWLEQQAWFQESPLNLSTLIANPRAIEAVQRYVEKDLNRCFSTADLSQTTPSTYEIQLAQEINRQIGPKGPQSQTDLIVDIHNTTANMGISLIIGEMDPYIYCLCQHLLEMSDLVKVYYMPEIQEDSPYLPTVAKRDICLEIGPQAHGCLRAETLLQSQTICQAIVNFTEEWNSCSDPIHEFKIVLEKALPHYLQIQNLDYPRNTNGEIIAMIHPDIQDSDYKELDLDEQAVFIDFNGKSLENPIQGKYHPVFINEQAYYEKGIAMSLTNFQIKTWNEWTQE